MVPKLSKTLKALTYFLEFSLIFILKTIKPWTTNGLPRRPCVNYVTGSTSETFFSVLTEPWVLGTIRGNRGSQPIGLDDVVIDACVGGWVAFGESVVWILWESVVQLWEYISRKKRTQRMGIFREFPIVFNLYKKYS